VLVHAGAIHRGPVENRLVEVPAGTKELFQLRELERSLTGRSTDPTRLKGHAALWWDELQAERRSKGKQKIKS
jgi:hypothetical protein